MDSTIIATEIMQKDLLHITMLSTIHERKVFHIYITRIYKRSINMNRFHCNTNIIRWYILCTAMEYRIYVRIPFTAFLLGVPLAGVPLAEVPLAGVPLAGVLLAGVLLPDRVLRRDATSITDHH